jgi:hypothetical protein
LLNFRGHYINVWNVGDDRMRLLTSKWPEMAVSGGKIGNAGEHSSTDQIEYLVSLKTSSFSDVFAKVLIITRG